MRLIFLDTETTGLHHQIGDRIVEIGCVEMVDFVLTGGEWHSYLNPQRPCHPEAYKVHKLTDEFLSGQPLFESVWPGLLEFLRDDMLVIHNAPFDMGFLNAELRRVGQPPVPPVLVADTLSHARRVVRSNRHTLDDLCDHFRIRRDVRQHRHGALMDAHLLAQVYIALCGGPQQGLDLEVRQKEAVSLNDPDRRVHRTRLCRLPDRRTAEDRRAHTQFVRDNLGDDPVWDKVERPFSTLDVPLAEED